MPGEGSYEEIWRQRDAESFLLPDGEPLSWRHVTTQDALLEKLCILQEILEATGGAASADAANPYQLRARSQGDFYTLPPYYFSTTLQEGCRVLSHDPARLTHSHEGTPIISRFVGRTVVVHHVGLDLANPANTMLVAGLTSKSGRATSLATVSFPNINPSQWALRDMAKNPPDTLPDRISGKLLLSVATGGAENTTPFTKRRLVN